MTTFVANTYVTLEEHICSECGVVHAIPQRIANSARERGNTWYCPNGHGQTYIEPEVKRLRRLLDQEQREALRLRGELAETQQRASRVERRAKTGTCLFCHRHFANVERHVEKKHPEKVARTAPSRLP